MPDKSLRFAALIRVSTEQQEKTGESLRTQRSDIERDVAQMGGTIAGWYGGQEHATPGHERKELDRLMADAIRGKFDAVIVTNADRWSRDNTKSRQGLEVFKDAGIHFFVSTTEYDLCNPEHCLFLGMSAVIGQFLAHQQSRKSIVNRIARAKRGIPTSGQLPYGRTFDKATGKWGIDPKKQAMVADVAQRYLAGEPLLMLAKEYGVSDSNLLKVLTKVSGTKWTVVFRSKALKIHETVEMTIPALLHQKTITAIKQRTEANRTYSHGQAKRQSLFGGLVFCKHCGFTMSPQLNRNGLRYYRHTSRTACTKPGLKSWVKADDLEDAVIRKLFDCFGNPAAVAKAVEAAMPNREQVIKDRERLKRIADELAKMEAKRNRVVDAIADERITEAQSRKTLEAIGVQEKALNDELGRLQGNLDNVPTPAEVKAVASKVAKSFDWPRIKLQAKKNILNHDIERMTWEEKRALVLLVFGGKTPDGKRMGVYVEWIAGQEKRKQKQWRYWLIGRLVHSTGTIPRKPYRPEEDELAEYGEFMGGPDQQKLLDEVSQSAWQ